ncbi:hypothetical protein [Nocardioides sp. SYSU D00065]|uniref:hypothetical protein n=1 Tax=Nocardioides sp. SYSU D00065 TaxID=2817378 RepID=UPI001B33E77E|nr:hypothetical protein [Nocardioides sp. SYSU D00065]
MTVEPRVVSARAPHVLARAVAATVVATTGAAAAHTWAGGDVPTGPGLLLVTAVLLASSLLLFAREVPQWALLPAVAAAQLGLHESFGLADHQHHAAVPSEAGWTWQMLVAHLCVAVLTAAAWWAGRRAASYVVSLRLHPALPVAPRPRLGPAAGWTRSSLTHLLVSPRRGPPLALVPA